MYYDDDVDAEVVADKTIAVIGYGSQGRGQSRNMADSGLNVIVGLREGGSSWQKAIDDGMNVKTIEEAAEAADGDGTLVSNRRTFRSRFKRGGRA